jgi:hypothetical protein
MNRWILCALIGAGIACASASAATNVIVQHNANLHEGTNYYIFQLEMRVTIILGVEGETFEFEAMTVEDPNDPNGTYVSEGDINSITALENAGPVTITVVGQPGHDFGARDIGEIDLDNTGVTGTIAALTMSGDFGAAGPMSTHYAGALSIAGAALSDINIWQGLTGPSAIGVLWGTLFTPSIDAPLSITLLWGTLLAGTVNATVAVDTLDVGLLSADDVNAPLTIGTMTEGTVDAQSEVEAGYLHSDLILTGAGPHYGLIHVNYFDEAEDTISIGGSFLGEIGFGFCGAPPVAGSVEVFGDVDTLN